MSANELGDMKPDLTPEQIELNCVEVCFGETHTECVAVEFLRNGITFKRIRSAFNTSLIFNISLSSTDILNIRMSSSSANDQRRFLFAKISLDAFTKIVYNLKISDKSAKADSVGFCFTPKDLAHQQYILQFINRHWIQRPRESPLSFELIGFSEAEGSVEILKNYIS